MEQRFIEYINYFFKQLTEVYGFSVISEINEDQSFMIEYYSSNFTIKIDKYFREFYTTLYKIKNPEIEINLFNLLEYIKKESLKIPKADYFHKEKNIDDCYRKQLCHISNVIYENFDLINEFFNEDKFESNLRDFDRFWKIKHPEFYN